MKRPNQLRETSANIAWSNWSFEVSLSSLYILIEKLLNKVSRYYELLQQSEWNEIQFKENNLWGITTDGWEKPMALQQISMCSRMNK